MNHHNSGSHTFFIEKYAAYYSPQPLCYKARYIQYLNWEVHVNKVFSHEVPQRKAFLIRKVMESCIKLRISPFRLNLRFLSHHRKNSEMREGGQERKVRIYLGKNALSEWEQLDRCGVAAALGFFHKSVRSIPMKGWIFIVEGAVGRLYSWFSMQLHLPKQRRGFCRI